MFVEEGLDPVVLRELGHGETGASDDGEITAEMNEVFSGSMEAFRATHEGMNKVYLNALQLVETMNARSIKLSCSDPFQRDTMVSNRKPLATRDKSQ